ncbi:MAG: carboxymuconolactone decarboxylase family protein [Planctomycetes bacterium]|nr:carboxymuconolactone decarboxylase family protein [Planctomycetota bacterium]
MDDRFLPLSRLAGAAARGDGPGVREAVRDALAAGCSPTEVREALRTVHLFCGFPRALDALVAAAPELGAPPEGDDVELGAADAGAERELFRRRGRALFDRVYGAGAAKVHARLVALDPALTSWVVEDAYGRVLAREALAPAQRERLAAVLLAAQGLRNQLAGHVRGALNCGATEAEVLASLGTASPWISTADLDAARTALRGGQRSA